VIKIKKLILFILLLIPISISSFKLKKTTFFKDKEEINEVNTYIVHISDKDLYLDLEDYVFGVVASEMPALFNDEALKAQAVAARSYAVSGAKDKKIEILSTINDQVYQQTFELSDKWKNNYSLYYNKILKAVKETERLVIKRDGKVLKTYYFSMSNGKTENSSAVFKEETFTSVDSPYETSNLKNFVFVKEMAENEMKKALNLEKIEIGNIKRNETNHVDSIEISGKTFTGIEIRNLLNLRSTDFEIKKDDDSYLIGMSQYGANEMAKNGYSYLDILNHYYQNVEISKI